MPRAVVTRMNLSANIDKFYTHWTYWWVISPRSYQRHSSQPSTYHRTKETNKTKPDKQQQTNI